MFNTELIALPSADLIGTSSVVAADKRVSAVSSFADMLWDRSDQAETRAGLKLNKINWGFIYRSHSSSFYPLIMSLKEFAFACMFDPIADETGRDMKTVQEYIFNLNTFIDYLDEKSLYSVADLTHADFQDYARWLVHQRKAYAKKADKKDIVALEWADVRIRALQIYYRYSKRVSQPIPVCPLHGENLFKYLKAKRRGTGDNRTAPIPKQVWEPYLGAALDYVTIYADDILHMQSTLEYIRVNVLPIHMATKKPFRATNFRTHINSTRLPKVGGKLGVFAKNPKTGKPWRESWNSLEEARLELYALHNACIAVIASLSGVRETELAELQVDGVEADTAPDGIGKRYRIISKVVKGNRDDRLTWEVNEPVYIACQVMQKLTSYARAVTPQSPLLLANWYRSPTNEYRKEAIKDKLGRSTKGNVLPIGPDGMSMALRRFAVHLDTALDGQYRLPDVDGKRWHFTMRQPRRTLAARIAREPFGTIAGMLHYKHVKVTTFLGYAGSDPSWIKDLHDEEIGANEEFLEQIWEDLQDGELAGAKGVELVREFKGVAGDMKKSALRYFVESHRANLHVGLFNYCFFQKDRALCLTDATRQSKNATPVLNACHPDRCANSCVSKHHLPQWQVQVDEARAMLAHKSVSPPQRIALTADLEKALRVVNQLSGVK